MTTLTSTEDLLPEVEAITRLIDSAVNEDNLRRILGAAETALGDGSGRRMLAIQSALLSDCLHVASLAISADGRISPEEIDFVFPLAFRIAGLLARGRSQYQPFSPLDYSQVTDFLATYGRDADLLGGNCDETSWLGLDICCRVAAESHDRQALERYERLLLRLIDDLIALGGESPREAAVRARLRERVATRLLEIDSAAGRGSGPDARVEAFCDRSAPSVFSSIAYANQVWERDPLDVETVHAEARDTFQRLVDRVTGPGNDGRGRIMLLLGESGSGKTHLMRAFRNYLHSNHLGYAAYMQMTTRAEDYSRYALANLIDSLERPYDPPDVATSGLVDLSDVLTESFNVLTSEQIEGIRDGDPDAELGDVAGPLVDRLLSRPELDDFDPDLLRVFLYLQRREPAVKARVLKYLRCEHLNGYDRKLLGDIAPRTGADAPQRTLTELGRLAWRTAQGAMVLLVDQLEDIRNIGEAGKRFAAAVDVLRRFIDEVPSGLVVISCLDDMYQEVKAHLPRPAQDRLERDPAPTRLTANRSLDEIEELVARRLAHLYESMGVGFREEEPLYPFRRADLAQLANFRTRDVLDWCNRFQEQCIESGQLLGSGQVAVTRPQGPTPERVVDIEQAWNDHRSGFSEAPPDDEAGLLDLLAFAFSAATDQATCERSNELLHVTLGDRDRLALSICNRATKGGWLARQIEALERRAEGSRPVAVRCSDFPDNQKTKIVQTLGAFIARGGRKIVVEDSDWRTLMALRAFYAEHERAPGFAEWMQKTQPLARLTWLRECLTEVPQRPPRRAEVDVVAEPAPPPAPAEPRDQPPPPVAAKAPPRDARDRSVTVGFTAGVTREPVRLALEQLSMHAGYLGSTGSGKTTVALNVIEQALAAGIPAILVDRKGDLCTYADPAWWDQQPPDAERSALKQQLRDQVEVAVYTPGEPRGRALALPVVPPGLEQLSTHERSQVARRAATALAAMMSYRDNATDKARTVILNKALDLLGQVKPGAGLADLVELLASQDAALVNAIGHLDTKHFSKLVEHVETLRFTRGHLLVCDGAEALDVGAMLAPAGQRTRLTIVSTKFLQDGASIEFWIARLLVDLSRWASANPAPRTQAVVMFDEADLYMPAQRKPATKEPMQDLLKRARSAGVGVFLSTQNPGDLDYKSRENIRTWFVGRVSEERSINKMKQLLSECRVNVAGKLAGQRPGEFFLLSEGEVVELRADRALMQTRQLPEDEILELARRTRGG